MKYLVVIFSLSFLLIGVASCSCNSASDAQSKIPDNIVSRGDDYLISKVGEQFFKSNIYFDAENSKETESGYYLSYRFVMKDKDFIDELISFVVNKNGRVIEKMPVTGIPDCIDANSDCYKIDEDAAKKIAEENELAEGIKDWMIEFSWQSDYGKYTWHVLSVTQESGKVDDYKAKGEEIFIDPNTGEVLNKRKWNII